MHRARKSYFGAPQCSLPGGCVIRDQVSQLRESQPVSNSSKEVRYDGFATGFSRSSEDFVAAPCCISGFHDAFRNRVFFSGVVSRISHLPWKTIRLLWSQNSAPTDWQGASDVKSSYSWPRGAKILRWYTCEWQFCPRAAKQLNGTPL